MTPEGIQRYWLWRCKKHPDSMALEIDGVIVVGRADLCECGPAVPIVDYEREELTLAHQADRLREALEAIATAKPERDPMNPGLRMQPNFRAIALEES